MISKLKTLIWYLKNPSYYSNLPQLINNKIFPDPNEKTRTASTVWCKKNEIPSIELFQQLGFVTNHLAFEELFPSVYHEAKKREQLCPYKMGGAGDLTLLYHLCESCQARTIIETGVAYGWSSLALLASISKRNGHLVSTDMPYAKMGNEKYVGTVIPEDWKSFWTLIRFPDRKGLPLALEKVHNEIDICHYDSDKSYSGRMFAYPLLWEALRPGGIFISDDINDNLGFHDFSMQIGKTPRIIKHFDRYIGIILK